EDRRVLERNGPLCGVTVMLSRPRRREWVAAGQLQVVAPDGRMVLVERDAAVQSADGRPRRDLVAPGRLDGERGDDTAKGAQPAVDLADIVQQRRSKYLGRDVVRQRSLHRTRNLYGMPAIGIGQALPQS